VSGSAEEATSGSGGPNWRWKSAKLVTSTGAGSGVITKPPVGLKGRPAAVELGQE
jgi:hypothetical protein